VDNLAEDAKPVEFGTKVAQEIGFDKISKRLAEVRELQYVILDGCVMNRAEDEAGEIFKTCPSTYDALQGSPCEQSVKLKLLQM